MKHLAGFILFCSIGMSCLAIPIPEPDIMGGDWTGRHLLRSSPVVRPAPAPATVHIVAHPAPAPATVHIVAHPAPAPTHHTVSNVKSGDSHHHRRHTVVHHEHHHHHHPAIVPVVAIKVAAPVAKPPPTPVAKPPPTPVAKPPPTPVVAIKVAAPVATVAAANVKKQETAIDKWLATAEGVHAAQFCKSLGIENRPQIYDGCLEDMMVMKNEDIAKLGALTTEEFLSKSKSADTSKRYCIASGDPHFTSYDRDIYHLQEEGIFVIAGSDDDRFEVQERVKKNGASVPGVPCCIIGAAVRFGDVYVEVDVYNYGKLRVNGVSVDLAKDTTKTYGGVQVRYGKQNIAWRGEKDQTTAMQITGPGGFAVMIEGGYCGTLEVNVPTTYFGKMKGLCGNADGTASNADFSAPDGKVMDVKRGGKDWQMSGYGGPTSPLSKWELVWKPTGAECLFASGCETLPATAVPTAIHAKRIAEKTVATKAIADKAVAVKVAADKAVADKAVADKAVAVKIAADKVIADKAVADKAVAVKVAADKVIADKAVADKAVAVKIAADKVIADKAVAVKVSQSKSSKSSEHHAHPKHLLAAIHKFHKATQSKMHDLTAKIEQLLKQNSDKQQAELKHSEHDYNQSKQDADAISLKYDLYAKRLGALKQDIVAANGTFISHYHAMMSDNAYLLKLQLFKPSFIATLANLKTTLSGLESGVNGLIGLKISEKVELTNLMFKLRNSTFASTDDVAHDFLQFLEKHKSVLTVDTSKADAAKKKLDGLQQDYVDVSKLSKAAYDEYVKFAKIVSSLKLQFAATKDETEMFDQLMHRVAAMLRSSDTPAKCKATSFVHDGARTQCAVDLIKSHSQNGLL